MTSKSRFRRAAAAAAVLCLFAVAAPVRAITAEEVAAHNLEARGGAKSLAALQSVRRTGHLVIPGFPAQISLSEVRARPDKVRQEGTFQGLTQVLAFDGRVGWQVQPFEGRKTPATMTEDEAKALRLAADIEGPWIDARAKGHSLEYLGTEEVDGTMAHKIRVQLKWGDTLTVWFDPDTWMEIRDLRRTTVRGSEQEVETYYSDYERIGGVYVPMREESGPPNSSSSTRTKSVWDAGQGNVPAGADLFAFPGAAATGGVK